MSGPSRKEKPFKWRDAAVEYIIKYQEKGPDVALSYFLSFKRMDKLKRAIKELSANQNGPVSDGGQADSGALPAHPA
jgi:hypothetical protein